MCSRLHDRLPADVYRLAGSIFFPSLHHSSFHLFSSSLLALPFLSSAAIMPVLEDPLL
jgi:hypothetical protein